MKIVVHQGSVLSPLLFIIVFEVLSLEFRSGVPWEDFYADDLMAESLEVSGGCFPVKKQWRRKTESKCRKDDKHDL